MNIVVWADKGGVGKTTLATSIAAELNLLLLDLDPQGTVRIEGRHGSHGFRALSRSGHCRMS